MAENSRLSRIILILLSVAALIAVAALGLARTGVFDTVFTVGPIAPLDFTKLERAQGSYLVAPDGFTPGKSDGEAPVLGLSAAKLKANWDAMIARQPDVTKAGQSDDGLQVDYVQRAGLLRLPDIITVRFIPMPSDPDTGDYSTLAVYSRALYGSGDAEAHKARVTKWLNSL